VSTISQESHSRKPLGSDTRCDYDIMYCGAVPLSSTTDEEGKNNLDALLANNTILSRLIKPCEGTDMQAGTAIAVLPIQPR
jgi:hypothetical protein